MEILVVIILLCIFGMFLDPVMWGLMQAGLILLVVIVLATGGCSSTPPQDNEQPQQPRSVV